MGTIRNLLKIKPVTNRKLPEGFKQRWIIALESGQYTQCKGSLLKKKNEGKTYCCLGVAASICEIGSAHIQGIGMLHDIESKYLKRLPKLLVENEELAEQLAKFNDGTNWDKIGVSYSFPQIAKWVEKYL